MSRRLHPIVKQLLLDDYKYSGVYVTTSALFDINEIWLFQGEQTDSDYRPGMVTGPEPETSAADLLWEVEAGNVSATELQTSYAVIKRYDELLRANGQTL